ncbi:MAG: glycosyltransferase family 9 protein [Desulfobacteraceae bacterium]
MTFGRLLKRCFKTRHKKIKLPESPAFLIILMGSLGDVTRGLCVAPRIKAVFPGSHITWLIEPRCEDVVSLSSCIDRVLVFDRDHWPSGLKRLVHELKKSRFDCVLDLQRHFKSGFFSFISSARYRIGFHPGNAKEGNWIFNNTYIPWCDEFYPKIQHYLKFAQYLGDTQSAFPNQKQPECLDFGISFSRLLSTASHVLSKTKSPFIAMVLGSTWVSKEWHFDNYADLIKKIFDTTDLYIVLVDTMAKYDMACNLEKVTDSSRLINLVGQTSVPELAAVLRCAQAGIGPDCGSAHIAAAAGTPYITLFGPTSPERTAPFGSEHLVVTKNLPCAPCYKKKCPGKNTVCMGFIGAEDVMDRLHTALKP